MQREQLNQAWSQSTQQILTYVNVNPDTGLTASHVEQSRTTFGAHVIKQVTTTSIGALILEGIMQPMMLILLAIAAVSLLFQQYTEAIAMTFVVAAYIIVELINKYRSDRIMAQLRALAAPTTQVIRSGKQQEIPVNDIVVGDIIVVLTGDIIPADSRIIHAAGCVVNEASLTGESLPVTKQADILLPENTPLAERSNILWSSTTILAGYAIAVVVHVGSATELGKIATTLAETQEETTLLQRTMTQLAKILTVFAIAISAIIPFVGFVRGYNLQEMITTWLALTFLMIPGEPPIIITMALALAAFAMATNKIIVKRLFGAEIIGQVTAVVSDKTGTITENKMVLEKLITPDGQEISGNDIPANMLETIALAVPQQTDDPTDQAVLAVLPHIDQDNLLNFKEFTEDAPWRILTYKINNSFVQAFAGKPENLFSSRALTQQQRQQLAQQLQHEAEQGKRITSFSIARKVDQTLVHPEQAEFIAMAVLRDPIRHGVQQAVATLRDAGVTTYIVTGDHPTTAQAIAKELHMPNNNVLTGQQLEQMSDEELLQALSTHFIFARTGPTQKVRIVDLLQQRGEIVAALGDGVNDSPALKHAHVGIAMGEIGADLTKEIADLILTDDSYAHVPQAIKLSRQALDNFKKGLTYYLTAKSILLTIFLIPLALKLPFPFTPMRIILIELLMDVASSTIFVYEQAEANVMQRSYPSMQSFLGFHLLYPIIIYGAGLAAAITGIYIWFYITQNGEIAQTAALVAWLIGHILLAINLKQRTTPLVVQGLFANYIALTWLVGMIMFSILITTVPFMQSIFHTKALNVSTWAIIILVTIAATCWIEVKKILTMQWKISFSNLLHNFFK